MGSPNGDIVSDDDFDDEFLALGLVTMQSPTLPTKNLPKLLQIPTGSQLNLQSKQSQLVHPLKLLLFPFLDPTCCKHVID